MYEYTYVMEEMMASLALSLISSIPSFAISIVTYIFTSLTLYTIAKRRSIDRAWLSWIPIGNVWILGSISDQFRYVTKRENKSKRKILLWLNIISSVLAVVMIIIAVVMVAGVVSNAIIGLDEEELIASMLGSLAGILGLLVPVMGVSIAHAIIYYMALYDLYGSCDPNNKTVFLIVGLIIPITQPVFMFICRNKDIGMPPRRVIPAPQNAYGYQNPYGAPQQNPYGAQQGSYQAPQYGGYQQSQNQPPYQNPYSAPQQNPYKDSGYPNYDANNQQ